MSDGTEKIINDLLAIIDASGVSYVRGEPIHEAFKKMPPELQTEARRATAFRCYSCSRVGDFFDLIMVVAAPGEDNEIVCPRCESPKILSIGDRNVTVN